MKCEDHKKRGHYHDKEKINDLAAKAVSFTWNPPPFRAMRISTALVQYTRGSKGHQEIQDRFVGWVLTELQTITITVSYFIIFR
jgi:hypothetical protein